MTEPQPPVVLALTPLAERAIEALLFGEHALVTPLESAAEADELKRVTRDGPARTVLLSPGLSGLTGSHCERLRADGLRLIGVALDEHEQHALHALSVQTIITPEEPAETLLAMLQEQSGPSPPAAPQPAVTHENDGEGAGLVLAVLGCKGTPGSSECTVSLARVAMARWPVLLLELDMLSGGLDVRIGADPQQGSLLGLARAATTGEPIGELLERWVTITPGWPPVLLAPPDPGTALCELAQPGVIAGALRALRARVPFTVCDVGFLLADGEEISPPARVHREALVCADAVLLVLGARDAQQRAGFAQLRVLLEQLAIPPDRLRIAVNGIGAPGASSHAALKDTLTSRLAEHGLAPDAWLTWDARALTAAHRKGQPLAGARPRGRYAKALAGLLDEMFVADGVLRARRHKLTVPLPRTRASAEQEEVALPWRR